MIPVVLVALLAAGAVLLIVMGLQQSSGKAIRERLATYAPDQITISSTPLEDLELARPFRDRVLLPVINRLAGVTKRLSPGNTLEKTEQRLAQAGNPRNINVENFYGLKGVSTVA